MIISADNDWGNPWKNPESGRSHMLMILWFLGFSGHPQNLTLVCILYNLSEQFQDCPPCQRVKFEDLRWIFNVYNEIPWFPFTISFLPTKTPLPKYFHRAFPPLSCFHFTIWGYPEAYPFLFSYGPKQEGISFSFTCLFLDPDGLTSASAENNGRIRAIPSTPPPCFATGVTQGGGVVIRNSTDKLSDILLFTSTVILHLHSIISGSMEFFMFSILKISGVFR